MNIIYDEEKKDLPNDQLHQLFIDVGWSDGNEDAFLAERFNYPFINSTLVISAWNRDQLVGVIRVLSDKTVRSVIYDLAISPPYQKQGIGKELIKRAIAHYPKSAWLVGTVQKTAAYYEKLGFQRQDDDSVFLGIPSKYEKVK